MRRGCTLLDRRRFVAGTIALPVFRGLAMPGGGPFAAGSERIRVGLVGCGGRGTGAALHAVAAAPGVTITAMADAFADQLASSAGLLAARAGAAFACPPARRFVGLAAWRHVLESDVDLVILATPPAFRPLHADAAVRAGKHVWCETPAAVDVAGVRIVAEARAAAAGRGLSFASGLGLRHDPATAALVGRIRDAAAGRPLVATVRADLGLPWFKPARPGWTREEFALRNWVSHARFSGGHLVERHVTAIDKALWVMGDADPVAVIPDRHADTVRYVMPDGGHVAATIRRRPAATWVVDETVRNAAGVHDLHRPGATPPGSAHPLEAAMAALVAAVRSGTRLDDGPWLCRATLAAILGRQALEAGTAISWSDENAGPPAPARSLQSV